MGNDIGPTGPRATGGSDGEPAHPVNRAAETPAHAPTPRAHHSALLAKLVGPVQRMAGAMRGFRASSSADDARAAELRAKTLDRARKSWHACTMDNGNYAQILDSIARSITFDGLFDEPPLGHVSGGAPKRVPEHPAHQAVDPSNVEELRTVFSDMLALSSSLPAHSQRHWVAALVRIAGMLPHSQGEQSEQRQALSAARQAWDRRKIHAADYAGILSMLGRSAGSAKPKVDPELLDDISMESLKLPPPFREALARSLEQAAIAPEQE